MRTALATLQELASEAEALPAAVPERSDIEVRTALGSTWAAVLGLTAEAPRKDEPIFRQSLMHRIAFQQPGACTISGAHGLYALSRSLWRRRRPGWSAQWMLPAAVPR
jgi:hypothetical protein